MKSSLEREEFASFGIERLLAEIAQAGGTSFEVRVHFSNGTTKEGSAVYSTDLISGKGPAIIFYDLNNPNSVEGVLPLGGHTVFNHPPRVSSTMDNRTHSFAQLLSEKGTDSITMPYDASAQECSFEII